VDMPRRGSGRRPLCPRRCPRRRRSRSRRCRMRRRLRLIALWSCAVGAVVGAGAIGFSCFYSACWYSPGKCVFFTLCREGVYFEVSRRRAGRPSLPVGGWWCLPGVRPQHALGMAVVATVAHLEPRMAITIPLWIPARRGGGTFSCGGLGRAHCGCARVRLRPSGPSPTKRWSAARRRRVDCGDAAPAAGEVGQVGVHARGDAGGRRPCSACSGPPAASTLRGSPLVHRRRRRAVLVRRMALTGQQSHEGWRIGGHVVRGSGT
jgi:hypothetical protein